MATGLEHYVLGLEIHQIIPTPSCPLPDPSGPVTACVGFRGCNYIRISWRTVAEKSNFRLYLSPPAKGPLTTVLVRAHGVDTVGAPVLRCVAAGPSEGSGWPGSPRAVQANGNDSGDPGWAGLPGPGAGSIAPPAGSLLCGGDAVAAAVRPAQGVCRGGQSLKPPGPVLLDGVEHAARRPLLAHLEPFQILQVQGSADLLVTGVVATHPFLHAGDKACDHVSKTLSQGLYGPVYAVPPFVLPEPWHRDLVYLAAGSTRGLRL